MTERAPFVSGGCQFLPDRYGWYCRALQVCVQLHPGPSGKWKAFRENHDVVSPTEAKLWGSPYGFDTPEDAAAAAVRIWRETT